MAGKTAYHLWVDPEQLHHWGSAVHPEHPARVITILEEVERTIGDKVVVRKTNLPLDNAIVTACCQPNAWRLLADGDTYQTPATPVLLERGQRMLENAVEHLVTRIAEAEGRSTFVLIRPPGHHATLNGGKPAGFCYQNNAWYAALRLCNAGFSNVAIFDWDVHHGDGTEALWRASAAPIRFCSMHAYGPDIYPGTGAEWDSKGLLNIPLEKGTGPRTYYQIFRERVLPFLGTADAIVISAGYDGHKDDPMGYFRLTEEVYESMSRDLKELGVPVLFVLEGGYHVGALARSVVATIRPWL
jgi:acetoin utilization deacetylase AcuC-like enzyme